HLLSCMELEKRNLFEIPALVRDFLWAIHTNLLQTICSHVWSWNLFESPVLVRDFLWTSGLLDLVYLSTRTSGIRNNNNNTYMD
ncbi:hypothetical protein AVEN_177660-1, partial [Araneus ventricosus]